MEIECKLCNKKFITDKTDKGPAKGVLTHYLTKHLLNEHNLTVKDYIIKIYFNDVHPVCKCGCGNYVKFYKKNALYSENHGFDQYFHCSHRGKHMKNKKIDKKYKNKYDDIEWCKKRYDEVYGLDNITNALKDYKTKEFTAEDIGKKYGFDFRTIKKIWLKLELIKEKELKDIIDHNRFKLSAKHRRTLITNKDVVCTELFEILKNFPHKFNITSLLRYYNDNNVKPIEYSADVVLQTMKDIYGEEVFKYLLYGYHSKEELKFVEVLKFYFGKTKIKVGKRLQWGKNKTESYIYDICINEKILIEYDSNGLYHNDVIKDKEKENFAINNGYIFFRVSLKYSLDPNLILDIKKYL